MIRDHIKMVKGRPVLPSILRRVCVHNHPDSNLSLRYRGDMAFDNDQYFGAKPDSYFCIQCGHRELIVNLRKKLQAYMLDGTPFIVGRNLK